MKVFFALFSAVFLFSNIALASEPDPFLARAGKKQDISFCEAGTCQAFGLSFNCGVIQCEGESNCGCSCLIESGAAYPKGYCGDEDPYRATQRKDQKGVILERRSQESLTPNSRGSLRPGDSQ